MRLKSTLTLLLMLSLMRCAHLDDSSNQGNQASPATSPSGQTSSQTSGNSSTQSSTQPSSSSSEQANPSPAASNEPLVQSAVTLWFQQRGIETRNLMIIIQPYGNGPNANNLPGRIQFKTPKPSGDQEKWRRKLRDDFSAWLVQHQHPEGGCTSVDLKPEQDLLAVDIQIVCR